MSWVPRIQSPQGNQETGWLSAHPLELRNYRNNYCQERPDCAGWGKGETRDLPVKASSKHCSLLKGLCQNRPPTHPLLGLYLAYLPVPTKTASLLNFWRPNWLPAPGENLLATRFNKFRQIYLYLFAQNFHFSLLNLEKIASSCQRVFFTN